MITDLSAFSGMEMENMTRGHGWRFLDVGRRLERSINLTSLLRRALAVAPSPAAMLEPLLEIADSVMTYRRRYYARPQLPLVLDLLLADHTNARALAFQNKGQHREALVDHRRNDHTSEIVFLSSKIDSGLGDDMFTVRALQR